MLTVSMKDEGQPSSPVDRLHHPGPDEMELMQVALQRVRAMTPEDIEASMRNPAREVAQAVSLAEAASTDSDLRAVATLWIEPLLDELGEGIIDEMESAMRSSAALRRAYAYAEHQLPDDLQRRLDDLLTEDDRHT
jgi:hypothetical protein